MAEISHLGRVAPGTAYVAANGDVVWSQGPASGTDYTITDGGPRLVNICVSVDTAVKMYVVVNDVLMPLNSDALLVADALYMFTFTAHPSDSFALQFSGNCDINYLVMTMHKD